MNYQYAMFELLMIGTIALCVGIVIFRGTTEIEHALKECVIWGGSFFVAFGAEMLVLISGWA